MNHLLVVLTMVVGFVLYVSIPFFLFLSFVEGSTWLDVVLILIVTNLLYTFSYKPTVKLSGRLNTYTKKLLKLKSSSVSLAYVFLPIRLLTIVLAMFLADVIVYSVNAPAWVLCAMAAMYFALNYLVYDRLLLNAARDKINDVENHPEI